ncbi:MAG TPA: restriction endonuclease subunit S [Candidatus Omnitrophota bacterium]|nr:restriction endonuclease subunit S [Candidatus Omnitrophota bacterium]
MKTSSPIKNKQTGTRPNNGGIPEGWEEPAFGEMAELIKAGYQPTGNDNFAYIGLEHINQQTLSLNSVGHSTDVGSNKFAFRSGDILFGKLRPYFRKLYRPRFDGVCSTDIWIVRAKQEIDQGYLFYLMASEKFVELATSGSSGTRMPRADWNYLKGTRWNKPPKNEQHAIAKILSDLDAKIELNHQMNKTLEQIAQAIFKQWFVDFEFPGHEKTKFVNDLPEGWGQGIIKECCLDVKNGGTPRRDQQRFWDGGNIPWLTSGEVRQPIITSTDNFITEEGMIESSAKWVEPFSVVVALYGATAGQVSLISTKLTTNQAVCSLIPKNNFAFFNYLWMRNAVGELENKAVGSAQQNISKAIVEETIVMIPLISVLEQFDGAVRPIFLKWIQNIDESKMLAKIRDSLLPRLMSGKIRVNPQ